MKKVFKILIGLMFMFSYITLLPLTQAEESENPVLIYVELPDDWESPHIWAWDADGTGAYANLGWPGKAMVADDDNSGWYYLYVPSGMTNIIVNANSGSIQTEAFTIGSENVWVTIQEVLDGETTKYEATTNTVKATIGDLPEYVATKLIFAYVPIDWDTAGIWAWNHESGDGVFTTWPGEEMTLLDDGWFLYEIPVTANRIIINNFDTTNGEQSVDLTVGNEDVYIRLTDLNDSSKYEATISETKPVIIEDGFKLYITVPEDWTEPCLWAWSHPDGTNLYTSWPGEKINFDQATGYYVVEIPTWVNKIIINNGIVGDGAAQTIDKDITETTDQYVYVGEADDEGKFDILIYNEPLIEENETNSNNFWIYSIVLGVVILTAGAVIFLSKRKAH